MMNFRQPEDDPCKYDRVEDSNERDAKDNP